MNTICHILLFYLFIQSSLASFDYYMLTQTWPPTFCKDRQPPCPKVPAKFTVHGLWPQNQTGPQPSQCHTNYQLDFSKFDTKDKKALQNYWPSLKGAKQNEGFWTHEWIDHGSCSMLKPIDYFKLALALHQQNLIAIILRNNGITPNATNTRTPTEIANAIKNQTGGKEPQLVCDTSGNFLLEVRICFEKSVMMEYKDCPTQTNCRSAIHYPA